MPTDRVFHPAEQARRDAYDHSAPKDSNFNPGVSIARGLNAVSRATGLRYNKGAVGVQQNADMVEANRISDKFRSED